MYLSCLLIDMGDNPDRPRPGRLWLRNLYRVHQRLCMASPSSVQKENDPSFLKPFERDGFQHVHGPRTPDQAFLFRIDPLFGGRAMIVVQSAKKPDWDYAFHNARYFLAAAPQVKPFNPHFEPSQRLRFRLLANPTKKVGTSSKEQKLAGRKDNGKRVPVPADKLEEWLKCRAESEGFRVERFISVQAGYVYMRRDDESRDEEEKQKGVRLRSARYEGILEVTDAGHFRNTLIRGIGPGKAFGFGLLSVAPSHASLPEEAT